MAKYIFILISISYGFLAHAQIKIGEEVCNGSYIRNGISTQGECYEHEADEVVLCTKGKGWFGIPWGTDCQVVKKDDLTQSTDLDTKGPKKQEREVKRKRGKRTISASKISRDQLTPGQKKDVLEQIADSSGYQDFATACVQDKYFNNEFDTRSEQDCPKEDPIRSTIANPATSEDINKMKQFRKYVSCGGYQVKKANELDLTEVGARLYLMTKEGGACGRYMKNQVLCVLWSHYAFDGKYEKNNFRVDLSGMHAFERIRLSRVNADCSINPGEAPTTTIGDRIPQGGTSTSDWN